MSQPIVHVFDDVEQLAHAAADTILFTAAQAVSQRGRFHWAVAGGETPKRTYAVLAASPHRERFPWTESEAWLGDERMVPATDPASNHRMVLEHLFRPAAAEPTALHAFDTGIDAALAARQYAERLGERLDLEGSSIPALDLVLLGLGADAHAASWFPGSCFAVDAWVAATDAEHAGHRRLTLTPLLVNAARRVLFLVSGAAKRDALARVFDGPRDPLQVPAQRVDPVGGQVMWMIDREAAGQSTLD